LAFLFGLSFSRVELRRGSILNDGPARPPWGCARVGTQAAMKASLGNLAARDLDELAAVIKNRLKRIQYRPALIEASLAQTGLTLEPYLAVLPTDVGDGDTGG
jgi:hypothetical protein